VNATTGIARLDALSRSIGYVPLSTAAMRRAAELWAAARREGRPTAGPESLDGDVILAAQAALLAEAGNDVVIATANVGHLARFGSAQLWHEIR
jgi:hypothetical protein